MQKRRNDIAVRLKRQAVLPVCEEALSDWKRHTVFKSHRVIICNRLNGENPKAWIDTKFFNRAVANLLDITARAGGKRKELSFSVIPRGWQGSCCIIIGSALMKIKSNGDDDDMNFRPDGDTLEIISQHRGKIEINEGKQDNKFLIHLPC